MGGQQIIIGNENRFCFVDKINKLSDQEGKNMIKPNDNNLNGKYCKISIEFCLFHFLFIQKQLNFPDWLKGPRRNKERNWIFFVHWWIFNKIITIWNEICKGRRKIQNCKKDGEMICQWNKKSMKVSLVSKEIKKIENLAPNW